MKSVAFTTWEWKSATTPSPTRFSITSPMTRFWISKSTTPPTSSPKTSASPPSPSPSPTTSSPPRSKEMVLRRHVAFRDNWTDYGGPAFTAELANGLVEKTIQTHGWLVPMIHGIDGGFLPLSSGVLREHLSFIKSHTDEIWVDTYADVARYQLERNGTALQVEDSVPGELTFSITDKPGIAKLVPLTVVLPLPLNDNTDEVTAMVASTDAAGGVHAEPDCVRVDLFAQRESGAGDVALRGEF